MKCKYEGSGVWEGRCVGTKEVDPCPGYDKCSRFKPDFITNADHIRSMTDEGFARWLSINACLDSWESEQEMRCAQGKCYECWIDWLKQPYKE